MQATVRLSAPIARINQENLEAETDIGNSKKVDKEK